MGRLSTKKRFLKIVFSSFINMYIVIRKVIDFNVQNTPKSFLMKFPAFNQLSISEPINDMRSNRILFMSSYNSVLPAFNVLTYAQAETEDDISSIEEPPRC